MSEKIIENNEELAFGMNFEEFSKFYNENVKFSNKVNPNHPEHDVDETFMELLEKGCRVLIKESAEIVKELI